MPDLPPDPMARVAAEVVRLRQRAAILENELKDARKQLRKQRENLEAKGEKLPPEARDTVISNQ